MAMDKIYNYDMERKIDELLVNKLSSLKYRLEKIVYHNPIKRRYTLIISRNEIYYILKWNHPDEYEHLNKLSKEINFYKNNKDKGFLPKLIYFESNLMIIEFIESITLREWLINYISSLNGDVVDDKFKSKINILSNNLKELYLEANENVELNSTFKSLTTYFGKLCTSVPMSAPRNRIEFFLLRSNWIINKRNISKVIQSLWIQNNKGINNIESKSHSIHADLHLNNIIVPLKGEYIKIIDWENSTKGTIFEDINYLLTFTKCLFREFPKHQIYIDEKFEDVVKELDENKLALFKEIDELYALAISVNRSFGYNVSITSFLTNLFKFQIKIRRNYK